MDIQKIYLETTMFSFYHEERTKQGYISLKEDTRKVFDLIKTGKYEAYTSTVTTDEIIKETNLEKRGKMASLITEFGVKILVESVEAKRLAELYLREKVVPESEPIDAAHIAITTANGIDFIVSLNFEHIVRPWTIERVRRINLQHGYKPIGIYKPAEVLVL
ncbi:hypothetical protein [Leadbettera azotonutricia]|uniref:PIN domain-containing protein n=1 Tax=Leadbettera azotonutricia (strain ATCC BAA-888 / DSM 13862 / ZAS-9) TaxID=545695 RepID=F5YCZ9_LEAAZ|nr:hypothetical protein [Leadbettera azotonutricia]AEF81988.1 conserved hypothetical protein [Leadbettera azotonutricia ZAS-9]